MKKLKRKENLKESQLLIIVLLIIQQQVPLKILLKLVKYFNKYLDSKNNFDTTGISSNRSNYNNNINDGPKTKIEKNVLDNIDSVPQQNRKSKNENKNKKDCTIF